MVINHGVVEDAHLVFIGVFDVSTFCNEPMNAFLVHLFCVAHIVHHDGCLGFALLIDIELHLFETLKSSHKTFWVLCSSNSNGMLLSALRLNIDALVFNQHLDNVHVDGRGQVHVMVEESPLMTVFNVLDYCAVLFPRLELVVVVLMDSLFNSSEQITVDCVYHNWILFLLIIQIISAT
tara:strand:- start:22 stop:558 length:537 start_codon:yes stop_codon:yes gene_type:complete